MRFWCAFAIILFLTSEVCGCLVISSTSICTDWYKQADEYPQEFFLYRVFTTTEITCYVFGLKVINLVFFKRLAMAFKDSIFEISMKIQTIIIGSIYFLMLLFVASLLLWLIFEIHSIVIIFLEFVAYLINFIYLIWLFIHKLKQFGLLIMSKERSRERNVNVSNKIKWVIAQNDTVNVCGNESTVSNTDISADGDTIAVATDEHFDVSVLNVPTREKTAQSVAETRQTQTKIQVKTQVKTKTKAKRKTSDQFGPMLPIVTKISFLACLALTSSFIAVLSTILIDVIWAPKLEQARPIFNIAGIFYQMDYLLNIICLALQFEYNDKYYKKYCKYCATRILNIFS